MSRLDGYGAMGRGQEADCAIGCDSKRRIMYIACPNISFFPPSSTVRSPRVSNQVISAGGVTYKNDPYHRDCFTCSHCKKSLAGERFTSKEEKPYCANCFGELFAKKCFQCNKPITGEWGPPSREQSLLREPVDNFLHWCNTLI